MPIDLSSLHLLVTRPRKEADHWRDQLQTLGAEVNCQPVMEIKPVSTNREKQDIIDQILRLDEFQYLIFISKNAARYGCEWISEYWPQLPSDLNVLAIGQSTAEILNEKLSGIDALAPTAKSAMNSESLLRLMDLPKDNREKILIFRGVGGREYLSEQLRESGALPSYIELYYRSKPDNIDLTATLTSQKRVVTVVHSGESLENLCELASKDDRQWLQSQAILVPGDRVALLAKEKAFNNIITAANATHNSMIEALYDWHRRHPTKK